jgi:hypothetical protein
MEEGNVRDNNHREMRMRFKFADNSIYELGYTLVDLNQILSFCDLLDCGYTSLAFEHFSDIRQISRHSPALEPSSKFKVRRIKEGSIEIAITGICGLAAVAVPLIIHVAAKRAKKNGEMVTFNIECDFEHRIKINNDVKEMIDFSLFHFGFDGKNVNYLLDRLSANEYNVEHRFDGHDVYTISKVFNAYADRIAKTVYKVPKHRQ